MRRGPAANDRQSQEHQSQQRSADDAWYGEVATSPQLVRRFQRGALGSNFRRALLTPPAFLILIALSICFATPLTRRSDMRGRREPDEQLDGVFDSRFPIGIEYAHRAAGIASTEWSGCRDRPPRRPGSR